MNTDFQQFPALRQVPDGYWAYTCCIQVLRRLHVPSCCLPLRSPHSSSTIPHACGCFGKCYCGSGCFDTDGRKPCCGFPRLQKHPRKYYSQSAHFHRQHRRTADILGKYSPGRHPAEYIPVRRPHNLSSSHGRCSRSLQHPSHLQVQGNETSGC